MTSVAAVVEALRVALARTVLHMVEPTHGPWVNQNTFGDQHTQRLPQTAGIEVEVLPKNNRMYGPPHVHSVNLSRGDETPAANAEIRARVSYGCGGIENEFDCDWVHGAQFAIVCNTLTVSAVTYNPFPASPYNVAEGSIFLGAMVAKGSTDSSRWPLTYTEPVTTMIGAAVQRFAVRDFARALTVHQSGNNDPQVATQLTVSFLDSSGSTAFAIYNVQVCAGGAQIPIPGGTQFVDVTNANDEGAEFTLQWFLGL